MTLPWIKWIGVGWGDVYDDRPVERNMVLDNATRARESRVGYFTLCVRLPRLDHIIRYITTWQPRSCSLSSKEKDCAS